MYKMTVFAESSIMEHSSFRAVAPNNQNEAVKYKPFQKKIKHFLKGKKKTLYETLGIMIF